MYRGYINRILTNEEVRQVCNGLMDLPEVGANEFVIVSDNNGNVTDYLWRKPKGTFGRLRKDIKVGTNDSVYGPRNPQQVLAMNLLKERSVPLKLLSGKFGTGKSMMCVAAAIEAIENGQFEKVVFVRNNIQVRDTEPLGALPGEIYLKSLPHLMPFADHCGGVKGLEKLVARGKLEVIPLAFLRGRSIRDSILYAMECENLTKQHIQLLMGRVDTGTQLWLDGDVRQRDRYVFETSRGIETLVECLKGHPLFGYVHLEKSERSEVAQLCDLLDEMP